MCDRIYQLDEESVPADLSLDLTEEEKLAASAKYGMIAQNLKSIGCNKLNLNLTKCLDANNR